MSKRGVKSVPSRGTNPSSERTFMMYHNVENNTSNTVRACVRVSTSLHAPEKVKCWAPTTSTGTPGERFALGVQVEPPYPLACKRTPLSHDWCAIFFFLWAGRPRSPRLPQVLVQDYPESWCKTYPIIREKTLPRLDLKRPNSATSLGPFGPTKYWASMPLRLVNSLKHPVVYMDWETENEREKRATLNSKRFCCISGSCVKSLSSSALN